MQKSRPETQVMSRRERAGRKAQAAPRGARSRQRGLARCGPSGAAKQGGRARRGHSSRVIARRSKCAGRGKLRRPGGHGLLHLRSPPARAMRGPDAPAWHQCASARGGIRSARRPALARLEAATPRGKPVGGMAAPAHGQQSRPGQAMLRRRPRLDACRSGIRQGAGGSLASTPRRRQCRRKRRQRCKRATACRAIVGASCARQAARGYTGIGSSVRSLAESCATGRA
jgi:hypothetical protein